MSEALGQPQDLVGNIQPGFDGIKCMGLFGYPEQRRAIISTPRKEIPEDEPNRILEVIAELREALREKFRKQLSAALEEAEAMGDPAIVPLKGEARRACLNIANIAADRYFFADQLQLVATAKINGGAVFVGRNPLNARRIDVEIEPTGSSGEFVATQGAETVSEFSYDLDEDVFRSWLDWLVRPS